MLSLIDDNYFLEDIRMLVERLAIKGNFIFCINRNEVKCIKNAYILLEQGIVVSFQTSLPDDTKILDYSDKIIIPAFTDLHTHAGQIANIGIGYNKPLLDWLVKTTFHEEKRFENLDYAKVQYRKFVRELWFHGLLHSVVMPTLHKDATKFLIDELVRSGLYCYVGKVNMDIPLEDTLSEDTADSVKSTEWLIDYTQSLNSNKVKYAVCPRFVLSCTPELMTQLGAISQRRKLPVHSHLSENQDEIKQVHQLYPKCPNYASVYEHFKLLSSQPTVMAHCVYSDKQIGEAEILENENTWIAHCPTSNSNLSSGIAPIAKLYQKLKIGLGSDVSGGHTFDMFEIMRHCVQCSKLRTVVDESSSSELSFIHAFYMATMGGGSFFGEVGSFLPGYKFNALAINYVQNTDEGLLHSLERLIFTGSSYCIQSRFINGMIIDMPEE
ncbi:hypothetical protein GJ496_006845 [Pomphorhynchus laevis]|nr:hypothetical protein GJ496_006845 [Pomphorhynchus laevis]